MTKQHFSEFQTSRNYVPFIHRNGLLNSYCFGCYIMYILTFRAMALNQGKAGEVQSTVSEDVPKNTGKPSTSGSPFLNKALSEDTRVHRELQQVLFYMHNKSFLSAFRSLLCWSKSIHFSAGFGMTGIVYVFRPVPQKMVSLIYCTLSCTSQICDRQCVTAPCGDRSLSYIHLKKSLSAVTDLQRTATQQQSLLGGLEVPKLLLFFRGLAMCVCVCVFAFF